MPDFTPELAAAGAELARVLSEHTTLPTKTWEGCLRLVVPGLLSLYEIAEEALRIAKDRPMGSVFPAHSEAAEEEWVCEELDGDPVNVRVEDWWGD